MQGLNTRTHGLQAPHHRHRLGGLAVAMCLLLAIPALGHACTLTKPGDAGKPVAPGSMIQVLTHEVVGSYLVITYTIEYPGMTKVRLYNSNNELLWRSQYVNDSMGEYHLRLKASVLDHGNYKFEFDYKNHIQSYPVSM